MKPKYAVCSLFLLFFFAVGIRALGADPWSDDQPIQSSFPPPPPVLTPKPTPAPERKAITISLMPLVDIPVSGKTADEYTAGVGAELYLGYAATPYFFIGLDLGLQDYPVSTDYLARTYQQIYGTPLPSGVSFSGSWRYVPLMVMTKYLLNDGPGAKPYFLLGLGLGFNGASITTSATSGTVTQTETATVDETDFLLSPGFGIAFPAGDNLEIFTQVRLDVEFTSQNNSDTITLNGPGGSATAKGNLSDDSPTLFLPLQAGIRFL